jgi:hypothetical protein
MKYVTPLEGTDRRLVACSHYRSIQKLDDPQSFPAGRRVLQDYVRRVTSPIVNRALATPPGLGTQTNFTVILDRVPSRRLPVVVTSSTLVRKMKPQSPQTAFQEHIFRDKGE